MPDLAEESGDPAVIAGLGKLTARYNDAQAMLLVGDGVSTAGHTDAAGLKDAVLDLGKSGIERVDAIAEGLIKGSLSTRRKIAWAVLSLLSGGVTLARATEDGKVGDHIVNAVTAAVLNLATGFIE